MNARQKAKYYKKKYEELTANQFVPKLTEEHYKIATVKVSRSVPMYATEDTITYIKAALLREMADNLDAYATYSIDLSNDRKYYWCTAKLDVVEKCGY